MLVPVVSSVAVITLRLSPRWLSPASWGLLWDSRAMPHPVPTLCLAGCWGARGYGHPVAFGWDPAAVCCVSTSSRKVQPFVWLAPAWSRGADGLEGFYSFSKVWLEQGGKGWVGDMWLARCEPGRGQAAGTGASLHRWRFPSVMLCAAAPDTSVHQVCLDMLLLGGCILA